MAMESAETRFRVIFDQLAEHQQAPEGLAYRELSLLQEVEEIAELRRIVLEVNEPGGPTYTST